MPQGTQVGLPAERIQSRIVLIRGHKVMLDADLAELYAVQTKVLLQAVKRNVERFPADFMFQLTDQEFGRLRSQSVTSNAGRGGRRYAPYAFTEQGVAMLSSVLRSPRAIAVNVEIMRAFVRLREMIATNKELAKKLEELEARIEQRLTTHDQAIAGILDAIRALMAPAAPTKRPIGFVVPEENKPAKPSSKRGR
jgi:ATP-dependent Clp protease ATP-binding subunit ClpA